MGGPVLGPRFDSLLCQAGPEPEAWHAPFCGSANILKMRILVPMGTGGVHLVVPSAGRRHWSPRPGPGEELILLEELHPGRQSHTAAFPSGLSIFPITHPIFQQVESNTENNPLHKYSSQRVWSTAENQGSITWINFPGVWLTTAIGDLEPCLP